MTTEFAIVATLVAYKLALVAVGLVTRRRTRDETDFYLGGRALGPVVASISASASSSSAWTLLGVPGFAYARGLGALWLFPACVGGFLLNWYVLAPALRRWRGARDAITMADLLTAGTTGPGRSAVRVLTALTILAFFTVYVAAQFRGAGAAFENTLGMDRHTAVVVGAAIVVFYTLLGGFWAVSVTDTLQGLMMAGTALVLPLAALAAVGPGELVAGIASVPDASFRDLFAGHEGIVALGFVLGLLGIGIGYPGQPHVINRFLALKEGEAALRRARLIAILWAALIYAGMILLGLCARVLLGAGRDPDGVFVALALDLLHPVVAGVMTAAVLSAIMSTADSQLLAAASAVTRDLGLGSRSGAALLAVSRLTVLTLSVVAAVIAILPSETIFDRVLFAWSAMSAAFGPLLLRLVLVGPVSRHRALCTMSVGLAGVCAQQILGAPAGFDGVFERVLPFAAAALVAFGTTRGAGSGER